VSAGALFAAAPGGAGQPSMLDPKGPVSRSVESLWWLLFGFAVFVFVVVVALGIVAVLRGRRARVAEADHLDEEGRPFGRPDDRFIAIGGVVVPFVILVIVGVATVATARAIWANNPPAVHIEVEAADWFWIVRQPGGITTANEIAVPVDRPIQIGLTSRDVIHSFWVPQLAPKVDMIPGQRNTIHFTASKTGIYRGQCAEFCGLQHAHMIFFVDVMTSSQYQRWLAQHRRPPPRPTSGAAAAGQAAFEQQSCAGCHTIEGTTARGTVGPNLTWLGTRRTLGAGSIDNTPANLAKWITDSQAIKPGNQMPNIDIPQREVGQIVAYLESQR
jgi:cytochrome c oxidase subunit 2